MSLMSKLIQLRNRILPQTTQDTTTGGKIVSWRGHTKVYDFEGYLVSDAVQDDVITIKKTFYPGTTRFTPKKKVLRHQVFTNGTLTDELWADVNGKPAVSWCDSLPDQITLADLFKTRIPNAHDAFKKDVIQLLEDFQKRTTIINYNPKEIAHILDSSLRSYRFGKTLSKASVTSKTTDEPQKQETSVPRPTITLKPAPFVATKPAPVATTKPVRPKLTPEMRKDRWEQQLLMRMERHDVLLAQKRKIESRRYINLAKKEKQLASVNARLIQNERAQHILRTRLQALSVANDRALLEQMKKEARSVYQQWQQEMKERRAALKNSNTPTVTAQQKEELKEIQRFKKESLIDYRLATKTLKVTKSSLKKLKSTKRQKTIFDLAVITREKETLERAIKTETDIFKYCAIRDRLVQLTTQKRSLLVGFRSMMAPKAKVQAPQPQQLVLPPFQPTAEK